MTDWLLHWSTHALHRAIERGRGGIETILLETHGSLLSASTSGIDGSDIVIAAPGGCFLGELLWITGGDGKRAPQLRCTTYLCHDQAWPRPALTAANGGLTIGQWLMPEALKPFMPIGPAAAVGERPKRGGPMIGSSAQTRAVARP